MSTRPWRRSRPCPSRLGDRAHHRRPRRRRRRRAGIRERLDRLGVAVPLVGDFHYIGHQLLADHPACAEALAKYRINPGNVGFKDKKDRQFAAIVEIAIRYGKPVRIGVNWGSLDQELLTRLMDENENSAGAADGSEVTREAIVQSALLSAAARKISDCPRAHHPVGQGRPGTGPDRRLHGVGTPLGPCIASRPDRGGHGLQGHRCVIGGDGHSPAAGHRRHDPHLADAGAGRRPHPRGAGGAGTAADHGLPQFVPTVAACPGCGRTTSTVFQELAQKIQATSAAMPLWRDAIPASRSSRSR